MRINLTLQFYYEIKKSIRFPGGCSGRGFNFFRALDL